MFIKKNLKFLIRRSGITQKALGREIGKERGAVNSYFTGKALPPVDVLLKICEFFGLTLDEIVRTDLEAESYQFESRIFVEPVNRNNKVKTIKNTGFSELELRLRKIEEDIQNIKNRL